MWCFSAVLWPRRAGGLYIFYDAGWDGKEYACMCACVRGIMLIYVHKCASVQRICAFSDEGENCLSKLYMLEYVLRVPYINIISIPNF